MQASLGDDGKLSPEEAEGAARDSGGPASVMRAEA